MPINWGYMRLDIQDALNDDLAGITWYDPSDDDTFELSWELSGAMTGISIYLAPTPVGDVRLSDHQVGIHGGWELPDYPDLENLDDSSAEYQEFLNEVVRIGREALWQAFE